MPHVVPIVEGYGEVDAVPILLRRIANDLGAAALTVGRPLRCGRQKIVKEHELARFVELAAARVEAPGAIVVLLDAHTDCPAHLGPELQQRASEKRPEANIRVVLAKQEYEAWFLAAIESLRGRRGIAGRATVAGHPEDIRGAKEYLRRLMDPGRIILRRSINLP